MTEPPGRDAHADSRGLRGRRPRDGADRDASVAADPRSNTVVEVVLRVGLVAALVLLLAGVVVQLASGHDQAHAVKMFDLLAPRSAGEKVMAVGMLVLALTPAARVVAVLVNWVHERDWRFAGIGAVVVVVLAAAVAVGLLG